MINFKQFKYEAFLLSKKGNLDLFTNCCSINGVTEADFFLWFKEQIQVRVQLRNGVTLENVLFKEKKWHFFYDNFERNLLEKQAIELFPKDGFFEAINKDGRVAAFLPEPSSKGLFRVSYYDKNGPVRHQIYNDRVVACACMAKDGYLEQKEGSLELLISNNEDSWNRGLWVCRFSQEYNSVIKGVIAYITNAEVQHLFANTLELINKEKLTLDSIGI